MLNYSLFMSNPKKNIENVRVDYDKSLIDFKSIDKSICSPSLGCAKRSQPLSVT